MLYPSIDSLLEKYDSKYTLVSVVAKRARKIRENSNMLIEKPKSRKYVGVALEEILAGKVNYQKGKSNQ